MSMRKPDYHRRTEQPPKKGCITYLMRSLLAAFAVRLRPRPGYDGCLVDRWGNCAFSFTHWKRARTDWQDQQHDTVFLVNGIWCSFTPEDENSGFTSAIRGAADVSGLSITGIYNASHGITTDLADTLANLTYMQTAPCVETLVDLMTEYLLNHAEAKPLTIIAHSQGGAVLRQSIAIFRRYLGRYSHPNIMTRLQALRIISFGSIAEGWPTGPRYTHLAHRFDPVPYLLAECDRLLWLTPSKPSQVKQKKQKGHKFSGGGWRSWVGLFHSWHWVYVPVLKRAQRFSTHPQQTTKKAEQ